MRVAGKADPLQQQQSNIQTSDTVMDIVCSISGGPTYEHSMMIRSGFCVSDRSVRWKIRTQFRIKNSSKEADREAKRDFERELKRNMHSSVRIMSRPHDLQ